MKAKLLNKTDGRRVFLVVCDKGDDPIAGLTDFARQERLTGSSFTAIGAVRSVTLGYFDPDAKEYVRHRVDEQCEVLSLVGDVAVSDGEPSVHAHIVLGKRDASAVAVTCSARTCGPPSSWCSPSRRSICRSGSTTRPGWRSWVPRSNGRARSAHRGPRSSAWSIRAAVLRRRRARHC